MFRELLGFMLVLVIVKFALPQEAGDLLTEILLKVLTLMRDLVNQVATHL